MIKKKYITCKRAQFASQQSYCLIEYRNLNRSRSLVRVLYLVMCSGLSIRLTNRARAQGHRVASPPPQVRHSTAAPAALLTKNVHISSTSGFVAVLVVLESDDNDMIEPLMLFHEDVQPI